MNGWAYSQLHLRCSCTGWHKDLLALRSLRLFSLEVFFIKSVFRKVYSPVHVCFNFIHAPQLKGVHVCVCVCIVGVEKGGKEGPRWVSWTNKRRVKFNKLPAALHFEPLRWLEKKKSGCKALWLEMKLTWQCVGRNAHVFAPLSYYRKSAFS